MYTPEHKKDGRKIGFALGRDIPHDVKNFEGIVYKDDDYTIYGRHADLEDNVWVSDEYKTYYKRSKGIPKRYKCVYNAELLTITREIFKTIALNFINRKAGVLIKGIGYFHMRMSGKQIPKRNVSRNGYVLFENFDMKGHGIYPTLYTKIFGRDSLKIWFMEVSHYKGIRRAIIKKLRTGYLWKNRLSTVQALHQRRNRRKRKHY